jgi:uncharacterized protein DUF1573
MRSFLAVCTLLTIPAFASAQLRFTKPTADLGELRGSLVYQHRFEFANASASAIEITDIQLGCGCLSPVLDKRVYQPGEKGTLLMHIRTLGQPEGARTWQAQVQYREAGKQHEIGLIVAAKIRNEVTVEPSIVAMLVETTLKQELSVIDHRAFPLKVVNAVASSPAIKVGVQPSLNGAKVTLEVSGAALTRGRQNEVLNIYTDDPNYRVLQVPITLAKAERPRVTASPPHVDFIGAGSQLVRVRSAEDRVIRIDKIECEHPALKCTWVAGPGNDATLKIAAQSGEMQTSVRVHVGSTVLTIPVTLKKD